jgi:GTP-binding protein
LKSAQRHGVTALAGFVVFIDEIETEIRGGDGGDGAVSFRRERFVPRGGPDGGDGGRGGSVYAVGDPALRTLNHLAGAEIIAAGRGGDGAGRKRAGRAGQDRRVRLPLGTEIQTAEGGTLGEIIEGGDELVLARGGGGGRGNVRFATPTLQVPRYAEKGRAGQVRRVRFTLKIIADVALVGPPNAGKSSLLAAMSAARPKVAAYPFTTLAPQLGIVEVTPAEAFAVVEVPGLLEGAAQGRGLGLDFLRHVERAKVLAVVVDVAGAGPVDDYATVMAELGLFDADLTSRVRLVIAAKVDMSHAEGAEEELGAAAGAEVIATSTVTGEGVAALKNALWEIVENYDHSRA